MEENNKDEMLYSEGEYDDREYLDELKAILEEPISDEEKKNKLLQYHENDIAELVEELTPEKRDTLYHILGTENTAEILSYAENIDELVAELEPEEAADIIESMDADDAIDVLEELPEEQREEIVALLDEESREDIKNISKYDEDAIGSRMTNNYIQISISNTVKEAMKRVVEEAAENDNVSIIYVVKEDETLIGCIELRDLIIARQSTKLDTIIKTNYPYFRATEPVEDCLPDMKEYGLESYAILDKDDKLVGVITSDDVTEAVDDSMGEDYAKFAGLSEEEDLDESPLSSVRKRLPWLGILLVLDLLISFTMANFEAVVAVLAIIAFFQTLVLDMAGNAGTQSLSVTIRMISTNEVTGRKIARTICKELFTGILNGIILGCIAFGVVMLYLLITQKGIRTGEVYQTAEALKASGIVGFALLIAMTVSSIVGSVIPIVFYKLKVDPAVASGPFITTINDVTALAIYYGLAALLFNIAL